MQVPKLNKTIIDGLQYEGPGGNHCLMVWESELAGFGLRIYPSGAKVFVVKYRADGRQRYQKIGKFGAVTLDQARRQAKTILGQVAGGADPQGERLKQACGVTVAALAESYLTHHSKPRKKTWKEDQRRIDAHILPRWGKLKVTGITRADVAKLHERMGKTTPYEANKILSLVSGLFSYAMGRGMVPEGANPAYRIEKFKEEKRDRWVTHEELPRLMVAIGEEPNGTVRAAIMLYLLTGCRRNELLSAKWEDVSFDREELRLPTTKAGRTHYIPLSKPAIAILSSLPRTDNPYILPGKIEGRYLGNINRPWDRIRKAAGLDDVRLHDLRRTVGSWMAQDNYSLHLIGRVLNHSNVSTTAIYARFGQDQTRAALEAHGQKILHASGLELPTADVVPIKKRG